VCVTLLGVLTPVTVAVAAWPTVAVVAASTFKSALDCPAAIMPLPVTPGGAPVSETLMASLKLPVRVTMTVTDAIAPGSTTTEGADTEREYPPLVGESGDV
jgi:hypothetical protein